MTLHQIVEAALSFIVLVFLQSVVSHVWPALGLDIVQNLYRSWIRTYTVFMPADERLSRRYEIRDIMTAHIADRSQYRPGDIAVQLLVRLLCEIPFDMWDGLCALGPASLRFGRANRGVLTDRAMVTVGVIVMGLCTAAVESFYKPLIQITAFSLGMLAQGIIWGAFSDSDSDSISSSLIILGTVVGFAFGFVIGFAIVSGFGSAFDNGFVFAFGIGIISGIGINLAFGIVGGIVIGIVIGFWFGIGVDMGFNRLFGGIDGLIGGIGFVRLIGIAFVRLLGIVIVMGIVSGIASLIVIVICDRVQLMRSITWKPWRLLLSMLPMGFPWVGFVFGSIGSWRRLVLEAATIVLWQTGLFVADKILDKRTRRHAGHSVAHP